MSHTIICFGEIVWDALPRTLYLGGAPFNVASHLVKQGVSAQMISRIGSDVLGEEVIRNMEHARLNTDLVQRDVEHQTGFVRVELDREEPSYEIVSPSAWDAITHTDEIQKAVDHSWALVYGSLSQRNEITRKTLQQLWDSPCLKVFDINLRPPFVSREHVEASLHAADIVKLNEDELEHLKKWYRFDGENSHVVRQIADRFKCSTVCVTKGAEGSEMLHHDRWITKSGVHVDAVDTIGAGDAYLATLLAGFMEGREASGVMEEAGNVAAFVATRSGAVPEYDQYLSEIQPNQNK